MAGNTTDKIKQAIDLAGGVMVVASRFDITDRAVRKWWQEGRIPAERIIPLCEMCHNQIKPHDLNPRVFPVS